ncbi:uncharacterized protein LOC130893310 [Diorhabda carinulata]|uniref:uncharacterized protein LOC130893310 n=1 Tax=Diorhabda carinulata TaxID=1163345 RepID=UPI0025A0862E|nr:uncharacterized protein LOC130893310 [Diorhabda carinulata]
MCSLSRTKSFQIPLHIVQPLYTFNTLLPTSISLPIVNQTRNRHTIHPELLNKLYYQKLSSSLCNYYSSEKYQKYLKEYVKKQKRILVEYSLSNEQKPSATKYLKHRTKSPQRKRIKIKKVKPEEFKLYETGKADPNQVEVKQKPKAITIIELILRQKRDEFNRRKGACVI